MFKKLVIFFIGLILVIAYIDLVDSFKHINRIISDTIKPKLEIKVQK